MLVHPSLLLSPRRALTIGSASLAVTLAATQARASEGERDEAPHGDSSDARPEKPHDDLLLTAGFGGFTDANKQGGIVSFTALRQKGMLGYGATFEYASAVFDYTSVTAAPMVGVFTDAPRSLRLGLAMTGGSHTYSGVGGGFISSSDPGASGTVAFIGARVFAGTELGNKTRFHLGLQLSADDDLARLHRTYTFQETAFSTAHESTASHTVGSFRLGAMLALGTAFDL